MVVSVALARAAAAAAAAAGAGGRASSHSSTFQSTRAALLTLVLLVGSFAPMTVAKSSEDALQSSFRALTSLERAIAAAQSPSQVSPDRPPSRVRDPSAVAKVVREVLESNSSLSHVGVSSKWAEKSLGTFPAAPGARIPRKQRRRRVRPQGEASPPSPRGAVSRSASSANGEAPRRRFRNSGSVNSDTTQAQRAHRAVSANVDDLDSNLGPAARPPPDDAAAAFRALAETLAADARRQSFLQSQSDRPHAASRVETSALFSKHGSWRADKSIRKWFAQQYWGLGFAKHVLSSVLTGVTTLVLLFHLIRKFMEHRRNEHKLSSHALPSDYRVDLEASRQLLPRELGPEWDVSRRIAPVVAPLIPMGSAADSSSHEQPVDKNAQWLIPLPAEPGPSVPFWSHEFRERKRRRRASPAAADAAVDPSDCRLEGEGEFQDAETRAPAVRAASSRIVAALAQAADAAKASDPPLPIVEARAVVSSSVRASSVVAGLAIPLGTSDPNVVPPTSLLNPYVEVRAAELAEPADICKHIAIELADASGDPAPSSSGGSGVHRCLVCDKTFSQTGNLNFHIRAVHDDERRFVCNFPDCGHSFSKKQNLTTHVRTHTGLKPFVCSLCHKSFARRNNLTRHLRTHTGARPYLCPVAGCCRRFADKSNLNTHMVTHTGQRKFECSLCQGRFFRRAHLKKHMRTHATSPESLAALLEQVGAIEAVDESDDDSGGDSDDARVVARSSSRSTSGVTRKARHRAAAPSAAAAAAAGAAPRKSRATASVSRRRSTSASVTPMLAPLDVPNASAPAGLLPLQPMGLQPLPLPLLLPEPLPAPATVSSRSSSATRSDNGSLVSSNSASTVSPHADSDGEGEDSSRRPQRFPRLCVLPPLVEDEDAVLMDDDDDRPRSPLSPGLAQHAEGESYLFPPLPELPDSSVVSPLIPVSGSPSPSPGGLDLSPGFSLFSMQPQPSGSSSDQSGIPVPVDMAPVLLPHHSLSNRHDVSPLTPLDRADSTATGFGASMPAASFAVSSDAPACTDGFPSLFQLAEFDPEDPIAQPGRRTFGTPRMHLSATDDFSSWLSSPFE